MKLHDSIRSLKTRLNEIFKKADVVDAVFDRVDGLSIQDLLTRVDTLESQLVRIGNVTYEHGDSWSGFVAYMEE